MAQVLLHEEYSKALSCYERALFYATEVKPEDIIRPEHYNLGDSAPNADDVTKDSQQGVPPTIATCAYITNIYITSGCVLTRRLSKVIKKYFTLQKALGGTDQWRFWLSKEMREASWSDRDRQSVIATKDVVLQNHADLIVWTREIFTPYEKVKNLSKIEAQSKHPELWKDTRILKDLEWYAKHWAGLNNICRLLMDEISYLSKRVDDMNGVLNTKRSIMNAIISIFLSVSVSCFSVWSTLNNMKAGELRGSLFNRELNEIKGRLTEINKEIQTSYRSLEPEFRRFNQTASNIDYTIKDNKVPPALQSIQDSVDRLEAELKRQK